MPKIKIYTLEYFYGLRFKIRNTLDHLKSEATKNPSFFKGFFFFFFLIKRKVILIILLRVFIKTFSQTYTLSCQWTQFNNNLDITRETVILIPVHIYITCASYIHVTNRDWPLQSILRERWQVWTRLFIWNSYSNGWRAGFHVFDNKIYKRSSQRTFSSCGENQNILNFVR